MEARANRTLDMNTIQSMENYHYVAPLSLMPHSTSTSKIQHDKDDANKDKRFMLSFIQQLGWINDPQPTRGLNCTNCAYNGNCGVSDALADEWVKWAFRDDFYFSQPFEDAFRHGGRLQQHLPPVDVAIYNKGYWGELSQESA
jgi:hypothetical protein